MKPTDHAFPAEHGILAETSHGMNIRTYLAGQAMQGILAHSNLTYKDESGRETKTIEPKAVAFFAVGIADALIVELNKEQK